MSWLGDRFELRVAMRYLWAARKHAHTAFLSLISTVGVTVGVATLIISLALLSGLQGQIKHRLMLSGPQLYIEPRASNALVDAPAILAELRRHVPARDVEPVVSGIGWASNRDGQKGRPVRLRSFLPDRVPKPERSFGRLWQVPPGDRPALLVTRSFAAELGLFLGDEVVIVAPRMRLTPFGPVPVTRSFVLSQFVAGSGDEHAPDAWMSFDELSSLFGTGGEPTSIEAHTTDALSDTLKETLGARWSNAVVRTWKDANRPLFLALRLEKIVMFATISLIVLVAALNLVSSLSMVIVEKRPQVGILRTLGASERSILGIFLGVGLLIGLTGTLAGNIIGLGASWLANRYSLVPLPSDVYYLNHIPFELDFADVIGVNTVAIALSVLATWYPARLASRLDPIEAIREE